MYNSGPKCCYSVFVLKIKIISLYFKTKLIPNCQSLIKVSDKIKVLIRGRHCYLDSHDIVQDIFMEKYTILLHATYSNHVQITYLCLSIVKQDQVDNLCVLC